MKRGLLFVILPLVLLLGGCAHVLSRDALLKVDPNIDFAEVKTDPQAFRGKTLVLGGMIVETRLNREGTTVEVLRYTLDRWGEPLEADESGGRFLARTTQFLDPELYKAGIFITLAGTVEGAETRPLQGYDYVYPVFRFSEVYLWSPAKWGYPYGYYPYYPPYYPWGPYYYYPDPFWYYPYRPWPGRWIR